MVTSLPGEGHMPEATGDLLPCRWTPEISPEERGRAWPGLLPAPQQSGVEVAQSHLQRKQFGLSRGRNKPSDLATSWHSRGPRVKFQQAKFPTQVHLQTVCASRLPPGLWNEETSHLLGARLRAIYPGGKAQGLEISECLFTACRKRLHHDLTHL